MLEDSVASPAAVARSQAARHQAELGFVYSAAIKGYSATLSTDAVRDLRSDPLVAAVVEDREVQAGVTYTVAAGNSSADAQGFVPAAYDEVGDPDGVHEQLLNVDAL